MMAYVFGRTSKKRLQGLHPKLVALVEDVLATGVMDFSIIEGVRTKERQQILVDRGASRTMNSKHIKQADGYGHAVDLYPYPIDMDKVNGGYWPEIIRFGVLAGMMQTLAPKHGLVIRWGMDWDRDGRTLDHSFFDAPHFEIKEII